jgi:TatD DNase family protein
MLIDTHSHTSDPKFNKDRPAVLERAREAGLVAIVDVGTDIRTSRRAVRLAAAEDMVYAVVGIHPYDGDDFTDETLAELRDLAGQPKVVALGEMGFDFFRMRSSREGQERAFRAQLDLAAERDLPVVLHLRSSANAGDGAADAYEQALDVLRDYGGAIRGISHCFSATPAIAEAMCAVGFHVSFAGNVTYPKADNLREAARVVPLDRILVETDCPYLTPQAHRGSRNEPGYVKLTAACVAEAMGVAFEDLADATTRNAKALFRIP